MYTISKVKKMHANALHRLEMLIFLLSVNFIIETGCILLKDDQELNVALMGQKLTALETAVESLKSQCNKLMEV